MSEQLEMKSLYTLATKSALTSRSDTTDRDARSRAKVAERRGGFDGFLKTFLGNDKTSGNGKSSTRDKTSASAGSEDGKAAQLTKQERRAIREAMEKTDVESEYIDEEIAAAAEEAAKMIWNLLYPGSFTTGLIAIPGSNSLAGLSNLITMSGCVGASSSLEGMEAGGLSGEAVGGAIETANASAEMNMEAVLSSLEELLDGMPRSALRQALAGVSGTSGQYDMFAQIAGALDAKVIEVNGPAAETDANRILSELGMGRQNGASATAETAGTIDAETKAYEFFKQFLQENFPNSASANFKPKQLEDLFESFARRLMSGNQDSAVREYFGEVGGLAKAATIDFPKGADLATLGGGAATDKVFAWIRGNLESALQSDTGGSDSSHGGNGQAGNGQDNGALLSGQPFSNAMAMAQSAGETNAPTGMSSMFEQMENIERLADAMKMANRGGVKNLTLQLAPVELGKVLLKVEARDGVVTASLRVEKAEAVAQLSESLNQLRDNLKAQGIELGEVDIRQHDFGYSTSDGSEREGDTPGHDRFESAGREHSRAIEENAETTEAESADWHGSGLNLFA